MENAGIHLIIDPDKPVEKLSESVFLGGQTFTINTIGMFQYDRAEIFLTRIPGSYLHSAVPRIQNLALRSLVKPIDVGHDITEETYVGTISSTAEEWPDSWLAEHKIRAVAIVPTQVLVLGLSTDKTLSFHKGDPK